MARNDGSAYDAARQAARAIVDEKQQHDSAVAQHDAENKALAQAGFVRTGGAGWQWNKGRASIWFDSSARSLRPWRYFPGGTGVDRRFKTLDSLLKAAAAETDALSA